MKIRTNKKSGDIMKRRTILFLLLSGIVFFTFAQITNPVLKAGIEDRKNAYIARGMDAVTAERMAGPKRQSPIMPRIGNAHPDSLPHPGSIEINRDTIYRDYTPEQLVKRIFSKSGGNISNVTLRSNGWNGTAWEKSTSDPEEYYNNRGLGYFSKGSSNFEMEEGLLLTTGRLISTEGPNTDTDGIEDGYDDNIVIGDDDLQKLLNSVSENNLVDIASILEFDFIPVKGEMTLRYVFASEEYAGFVGSNRNDIFGFFISPKDGGDTLNLALLPNGEPVSINTVNAGQADYVIHNCLDLFDLSYAKNSEYYVNIPGLWAQDCSYVLTSEQERTLQSMEYNGRTTTMTASCKVEPGRTYHIKLAVGNVGDFRVQSGVFLEASSFDAGGCVNDYATTLREDPVNIPILENDELGDCSASMLSILTQPANGTATLSGDQVIFTPNAGFVGQTSFEYQLICGELTLSATVYVTVNEKLPDNIIDVACEAPAPVTDWSIREVNINRDVKIHNYASLMAGDIDADSIVEVIAHDEIGTGANYPSRGLKLFYYDQQTERLELKNTFQFAANTSVNGSAAMARYNDTGYIVVAGLDYFLYAYEPNGNLLWKSDTPYRSTTMATMLNITNFDGDSIPEVYTGNQVFSLATGVMLCDGGTGLNSGPIPNYSSHFTAAADMDGDGLPEIVAGTDIYKITITNKEGTGGNSISLISGLQLTETLPTGAVKDGGTQVADIDNDGIPEVIVFSGNLVVYVWKPLAGNQSYIMGSYRSPANPSMYSIPMIGNIDDTPYPEIVFIANGTPTWLMYTLKIDPLEERGSQISLKWTLQHTDYSGETGTTLFDFNLDGQNEIVYRDQTQLRIINGSGATPAVLDSFQNVISDTLREFPLIADIDGDGQAEIVVSGGETSGDALDGYLRLFKTGGAPWAPARKVWNQYAYNALNVNEDLTIPKFLFNPATIFPGKDGELDTEDDVRPYNNFLQQQTILNENGIPLWLAPNGQIADTPVFRYNETTQEMNVTVKVRNIGDAAFQSPFRITVYKDEIGNTTSYTYSHNAMIIAGDTASITFTIPGFAAPDWLPHSSIVLNINDKGDGLNDQVACDDSNTQYSYYGLTPQEQDICQPGDPEELSFLFTISGNNTYQWQSSIDNTNWTDIPGATAEVYTPVKKLGITYYRVVITGDMAPDGGVVNSGPATVRIRSCHLPVNPNVRSRLK